MKEEKWEGRNKKGNKSKWNENAELKLKGRRKDEKGRNKKKWDDKKK